MSGGWYFLAGGAAQPHGPVSVEELRRRVAAGELAGSDLVWTAGMADWVPVSACAELLTPAPVPLSPGPRGEIPPGLLGWATFVGVTQVILGVLQCLTCVGLLTGIPFVVAGVALLGAKAALENLPQVDPALEPFLVKLRRYVTAMGFLLALSLIAGVVAIGLHAALFAAAWGGSGRP